MRGLWPAVSSQSRGRGHSFDASMTVRVYNNYILTKSLGPIYEQEYEKRCARWRMPGRCVVVGTAYIPLGNGQGILRRRVFACLSADDRSAHWSNYYLRGSAALESPLKRRNPTRRVHRSCRRIRVYAAPREVGIAGGARRGSDLARRHPDRCQHFCCSISRRRSYSSRTRCADDRKSRSQTTGTGSHGDNPTLTRQCFFANAAPASPPGCAPLDR